MRTFLRGKVTLLCMMLGLLLAIPAVALADEIRDDLNGANQTKTISTGGTFTNTYWVRATNNDPTNAFNG
jgi:hypothetical protein